ncbi:MAG: hypothetical protein AB1679_23495 [Actinomycetota bacterium]
MGNRVLARLGLGPAIFIFVALWAVVALVCLTGTLIRAKQIDKKVAFITHNVSDIDTDTNAVELVQETRKIAKDILAAAEPLPGQLEQIAGSAGGIDQSASGIVGSVSSIDTSVDSIGERATSINQTAHSINEKATSIDGKAKSINTAVDTIGGHVGEINGSAKGILGNFSAILEVARSIDGRLVATNEKAQGILAIAQSIRSDIGNILEIIGQDRKAKGGNTVLGHANSIDCSPLVNRPVGTPAEPSTYCQQ